MLYDGTIFHRNIEELMIQGGDPTGTREGGTSIRGKKFNVEIRESLTVKSSIMEKSLKFSLVHEDNIEFKEFGLRDNVAQFCVLKPHSYLINFGEASMVSYCTSSGGTNSFSNTSVVNAASHHFQ
ncbi:peptidyl-prolyl cis-trans isomerase CYP18-1 isoform X2 [Tanacetum coccineum]